MVRLHVNVDHIATLRQARGGSSPDPVSWALACEAAGAHGITCHLRKDRRHIQDADVLGLRESIQTLLNFECCLAPDIVAIAMNSGADAFCLVPENRKEVTTEGGLDVARELDRTKAVVSDLRARGGLVSLFIDPEEGQVEASARAGAEFIELHTGAYSNARNEERTRELERLHQSAERAHALGLRVNAGHGLDYDNVTDVARLPHIEELNIGHALVSHALTVGVTAAVQGFLSRMR